MLTLCKGKPCLISSPTGMRLCDRGAPVARHQGADHCPDSVIETNKQKSDAFLNGIRVFLAGVSRSKRSTMQTWPLPYWFPYIYCMTVSVCSEHPESPLNQAPSMKEVTAVARHGKPGRGTASGQQPPSRCVHTESGPDLPPNVWESRNPRCAQYLIPPRSRSGGPLPITAARLPAAWSRGAIHFTLTPTLCKPRLKLKCHLKEEC